MWNRIRSWHTQIEPVFWQETSRISSICLFAGWVSLYYSHFAKAPVSIWWIWIFSSITLLASAAFGNHFKFTYQNQKSILQYLVPGFIIFYLVSMQIIRYPHDWLFFSPLIRNTLLSLTQTNQLPLDFWHFPYLLILTWRGLLIGRAPASMQSQQRALSGFLFWIIAYQIIFEPGDHINLLIYFLVIFTIGLIGLPAARIVTSSMLRGGRLPKVHLTWVLSIIAVAISIVIVGVLSSFLANLEVAKILSSLLISLFTGLIFLIFLALTPLAYAIMLFFSHFFEDLMAEAVLSPVSIQSGQEIINQAQEQTQEIFHQNMLSLQNYLLIAICIGIIIGIWITLKRKAWENKNLLALEEGNIGNPVRIKPTFPFDIQSLRNRLNLPPVHGLSAIRIRWIYASLCHYGKILGVPRKPAVTPLEYRMVLHALFPDYLSEVNEITTAYIAVRYGNIPEDPAQIEKLQKSWALLEKEARSSLQSLKAQQKKKKSKD